MRFLHKLRRRARALFHREKLDAEMDEEMRWHLEMLAQEYIQTGMSAEDARYAALRDFGRVERIKERYRDQLGLSWLEDFLQDVRCTLRSLRKNPGFTAVAVVTLALGIGATTVVFSIVNGVLVRPLDYPGSERIVNVWESEPERGTHYPSPATFVDWRRENQVFEAIGFAAHHDGWSTLSFVHSGAAGAERLPGRFVSTNYFKVFGLEPILGRAFLPEEEARGSPRVVVISHGLWQRLFHGNPAVVGKSIDLENQGRHRYEIIGVMPEGFRFPGADLWVSCAHMPRDLTRRAGGGMHVVARLKPEVSRARAEMEMNVIQSGIHSQHGKSRLVTGSQVRLEPLLDYTVGSVRGSLMVFLGAVGLVLLIACANVANLQMSRALSRQREMSVRAALGANRWRIVRQLLCESTVLSLLGGIAGTILAHAGTALVVHYSAGIIPRLEWVRMDLRVFLFALAVSLVTGILFGLAPAWHSSKTDLNESLKEGTQRVSSGLGQFRIRNIFTVSQVALALILLIGAGLLLRSYHRLQNAEVGFDTDELLTVELTMIGEAYENHARRRVFLHHLMETMRTEPGVESACAVSMVPDRGQNWPTPYVRLDRPPVPILERPQVGVRVITPDYLKTYGIRLLRGREFNEFDTAQSERVLLINQSFADKVFPGDDPVGQYLECGGLSQIIGVIADVKNTGLAGETKPEAYGTYQQWFFQSAFLTLRARANPRALIPIVTERIRELNPDQPLSYFMTMRSLVDQATVRPRFRSSLLGSFALVALILAAVGIYGVMAYSVTQRTNDLGLRMALGARKSAVMLLVLRQGMKLTLVGVAIGLAGAAALTHVLRAYLYGISAFDLTTYMGVTLLLTLVALAACLIPALRATQVEPMEALRRH